MFLPPTALSRNAQMRKCADFSVNRFQRVRIVCCAFQNRYEYCGKPTIHKNDIISTLRYSKVVAYDWWELSVLPSSAHAEPPMGVSTIIFGVAAGRTRLTLVQITNTDNDGISCWQAD